MIEGTCELYHFQYNTEVCQMAMVWESATFHLSIFLHVKLNYIFHFHKIRFFIHVFIMQTHHLNPITTIKSFLVLTIYGLHFLTSSKYILPDCYILSGPGWLWFDSKWKICVIVSLIWIFLPFTVWILEWK